MKRIRWITREEAEHLKKELPSHLADAMAFALHTGLRESNVASLEWSQIDFKSGTSLQELQQLGGWASFVMVLRYAHLSSSHLKAAAERISATISLQRGDDKVGIVA